MTITEGLKELKLIEKKLKKNCTLLEKYSSQPSNEKPYFTSEQEQKKEIDAILQSSEDLVKNYLEIHRKINVTNLKTMVEMNGHTYSIHSLIQIRRKLASLIVGVYQSLNDNNYYKSASQFKNSQNIDLTVTRFYEEKQKQSKIRHWEDFYNSIDGRLETINATTQLIEE